MRNGTRIIRVPFLSGMTNMHSMTMATGAKMANTMTNDETRFFCAV